MSIRQINLSYVQEQDRILLRMSTVRQEEVSIWLTRLILLRLLPELYKLIASIDLQRQPGIAPQNESGRKMVAEFQQQEALRSGDFKAPYQRKQLTSLVGNEPLLATSITLSATADGMLVLGVVEKCRNQQRTLDFRLTPQLYHGLSKMLSQALETAQWQTTPTATPPPSVGSIDEKPRYLN